MNAGQSRIFALGTGSHSYLESDLRPPGEALTLVQLIAGLSEPRRTTGGVNLEVGFRPSLWASVAPQDAPEEVTDFEKDLVGVAGTLCLLPSMTYGYGWRVMTTQWSAMWRVKP